MKKLGLQGGGGQKCALKYVTPLKLRDRAAITVLRLVIKIVMAALKLSPSWISLKEYYHQSFLKEILALYV